MSLTLHGHQVLLIATLAFAAAVLTPNWYTSPDGQVALDVFQICSVKSTSRSCEWTFNANSSNVSVGRSTSSNHGAACPWRIVSLSLVLVKLIYPTLIGSFAIICAGTSLIALLLGSWYIHRYARENDTKWLLILTIVTTLLSCRFPRDRPDEKLMMAFFLFLSV